MVFSATFPNWLRENIFNAVDANQLHTIDLIEQHKQRPLNPLVQHQRCLVAARQSSRRRLNALAYIIESHSKGAATVDQQRVLVFCATRDEASLLTSHPWMQARSRCLHAHMTPIQRKQSVQAFKRQEVSVLLSTDLAARGLNFPQLGLVVHYSPPASSEAYIHRAGRAARAEGSTGRSLVIYDNTQAKRIHQIERETGQALESWDLPSDDVVRGAFLDKIEAELIDAIGVDKVAFSDSAKENLQTYGARLLAAALVLLERRRRCQTWKSVLSGRYGYSAVLIHDPFCQIIRSRPQLVSFLTKCVPPDTQPGIGRIALTKRGYVVDLPVDVARVVLRSPALRESSVKGSYIAQLPTIVMDEMRHRLSRWRNNHKCLATLQSQLSMKTKQSRRRLQKRISRCREQIDVAELKERSAS
eukprot:GHVS01104161.1.p1 GENE.GHVS01104161.1~~GHVS01104161.1.p1  ORF type:complete len:416 (-),score=53.77 GHVS01104161.1:91-1338(-)